MRVSITGVYELPVISVFPSRISFIMPFHAPVALLRPPYLLSSGSTYLIVKFKSTASMLLMFGQNPYLE